MHEHRLAQGLEHSVSAIVPRTLTSCFELALQIENVDVHTGQGTLDISETQDPGAMMLSSLSNLNW